MSGSYPDGTNQASFDRYWENKLGDAEANVTAKERQIEWLAEIVKKPLLEITKQTEGLNADLEKVAEQVIKTCETMSNLEKLKNDLAAALRECLEDYCLGCGFGRQGCSNIHYWNCRMLKLLENAEGRRLKLNMEPEEE